MLPGYSSSFLTKSNLEGEKIHPDRSGYYVQRMLHETLKRVWFSVICSDDKTMYDNFSSEFGKSD